jgi:hypothetical protein
MCDNQKMLKDKAIAVNSKCFVCDCIEVEIVSVKYDEDKEYFAQVTCAKCKCYTTASSSDQNEAEKLALSKWETSNVRDCDRCSSGYARISYPKIDDGYKYHCRMRCADCGECVEGLSNISSMEARRSAHIRWIGEQSYYREDVND